MSGGEDDFTGYVGARWPALVRSMVLMGCPADLAPDVVSTGLARCRRGWREAAEHDDLEVVVHRAVLEAWAERRRGAWWSGARPRTDDEWPLPDLSALDRLTSEVRAGLVLRRYSSLDPAQAAAVAGRDAGGPLPNAPDGPALRTLAESVVVYAPPAEDELVATAAARRRRLVPVAGVLAVALVLGGGTWWANRSADDGRGDPGAFGPVEPRPASNAAEVAWYAEGLLHLANATYRIPGVRQVAVLGAGAAYGNVRGDVVLLADDGTRTRIGTKEPSAPLVASDEEGWVVWVDPGGGSPTLLVYDLGLGERIGELDLPASSGDDDTRPVAVDSGRVYFQSSDGWGEWVPGEAAPVELGQTQLYDVSSRNRITQSDLDTIRIEQSFFNEPRDVPGRGGELSLDGNYAVTRNPDDGTVLVYDTRSGEQLDVAPPFAEGVIDAVLSPPLAITYITQDPEGFAQQEGSDSNPVEGQIVTCRLGRFDFGECETPVTFVIQSEGPILAR